MKSTYLPDLYIHWRQNNWPLVYKLFWDYLKFPNSLVTSLHDRLWIFTRTPALSFIHHTSRYLFLFPRDSCNCSTAFDSYNFSTAFDTNNFSAVFETLWIFLLLLRSLAENFYAGVVSVSSCFSRELCCLIYWSCSWISLSLSSSRPILSLIQNTQKVLRIQCHNCWGNQSNSIIVSSGLHEGLDLLKELHI